MLRLVFVVGMMLEVVSSVSAQTNREKLIQYLECLRLPQVQHELSLTKGQLSKIYEVQSQFSKELQMDPQFPDLPAEERARFGKEWLAKMDVLADRLLPQIVAVLSSEQFQRLQQINWQRMGSEALLDGELIKLLNFTEEQTARHASVIRKAAESLTNAKSRSIESKGIRAARDQSLLEILSDEQKKLFEDLKGKKIDLSTLASGQRSMVGRAKQTESDSRENRDRPTETIRKLIQSGSLDDAANEIESSFKSFESRSSADLRLQLAQKFIKAKRKKEAIVQATKAAEYLLPMITNRAVAKDGGGLAIHARSISRAAGLCSQAGNSKRADGWIEQALQSISSELTADAWSPIRPAYSDLLRTKAIRLVANKQLMHARELLDADASLAESLVCEHLVTRSSPAMPCMF